MRSWEDRFRPGAAARGLPKSCLMVSLSLKVETGLPFLRKCPWARAMGPGTCQRSTSMGFGKARTGVGFGLSMRLWTRLPCVQASVFPSGKRRTYENSRVVGVPWRQVLLDAVPQGCVQSASALGNRGVWVSRSEAPMIQVPDVRTRLRPQVRGEACRSPPPGPAGLRCQPVSPLLTRPPSGSSRCTRECSVSAGRGSEMGQPLPPVAVGNRSLSSPSSQCCSPTRVPGCRSPAWRADRRPQARPTVEPLRAERLGQAACGEEAEAWRQPRRAVPGSSVSANACSASHPGTGAGPGCGSWCSCPSCAQAPLGQRPHSSTKHRINNFGEGLWQSFCL